MNRFDVGEPSTIENVRDYRRVKYVSAKPNKKLVVFAAGAVAGMVYFYISGGVDINIIEDRWISSFLVNENIGLFQYIFSLRIKQLLFLLICSFSYIGNFFAYSILGCLGFEIGLILFTFAYNFKIMGLLISAAMFFPQGIFYLLLLFLVFEKCFNGDKPSIYKEKIILLWKIIMCVILFLLGFLCETCINFEIMQKLITTLLN